MKLVFEILLFMVCLNLSVGLILNLGLAGTEFVNPAKPNQTASEYEAHFNASDTAGSWKATPFSGIPIIGDIYSTFDMLFQNIKYLVDGFPMFLDWIGDNFSFDAETSQAFEYIKTVLRGIYAIMMFTFVIEFISGRDIVG